MHAQVQWKILVTVQYRTQDCKYMMINGINDMINLAHVYVRDRDYSVFLSMCTTSQRLHVFKYNEVKCTYEVFDSYDACCQFLEKPL